MNPYTGEVEVRLGAESYSLRFTWDSLAAIETAHGENPNLFSPEVVASVAAIGFKTKHPEMTAERITELSPPLMPFAQTVQKALQWAYFGMESLPEDSDNAKKKTNPERGGLWPRIKQLWRRG